MTEIKTLEAFLDILNNLESRIAYLRDELQKCENQTQDLLHLFELGSYEEARKAASCLRAVRKSRRKVKDELQVITPLYKTIYGEDGKQKPTILYALQQALGEMRKADKYVSQPRTYKSRSTILEKK